MNLFQDLLLEFVGCLALLGVDSGQIHQFPASISGTRAAGLAINHRFQTSPMEFTLSRPALKSFGNIASAEPRSRSCQKRRSAPGAADHVYLSKASLQS